jgi:hypothetical protein
MPPLAASVPVGARSNVRIMPKPTEPAYTLWPSGLATMSRMLLSWGTCAQPATTLWVMQPLLPGFWCSEPSLSRSNTAIDDVDST